MNDTINRSEAIHAILSEPPEARYPVWYASILKDLPKARKEGRWVKMSGYATPGGDPVWCCSECGKGIHTYGIEAPTYGGDIAEHQWLSCPNCDAYMGAGLDE